MKIAIYPGSFDPIHEGHKKIILKAVKLFDKVIVLVSNNEDKKNQSKLSVRKENAEEFLKGISNIEVLANENKLTAKWAEEHKVNFIIRSGRNNIDFEYELELAGANKHINPNLETVIIMPEIEDTKYSSRLIKNGVK